MDIDFLLKTKGVTKVELANRMGIQKQNVNTMLKNPTYTTLEKIAEALGVQMWELFATKEEVVGSADSGASSFVCPHCGKAINIRIEK